MTFSRSHQLGNKVSFLNCLHTLPGICRLERPYVGLLVVENGSLEGCSRRFRCSDNESSVVARDRRRKSRRAVVLKQNDGDSVGISDGLGGAGAVGSCDMVGGGVVAEDGVEMLEESDWDHR